MIYPNYYQGTYYPQYQGGAAPDMLNQYKAQYQQPMQMQQVQMPSTSGLIFVLNEQEAISYPVAPNNNVILWDKNEDVVYIKSANAQGVPSMRILDYVERTAENGSKKAAEHECQCGKEFVRAEDFEALKAKFEGLSAKVESIVKAKEAAE